MARHFKKLSPEDEAFKAAEDALRSEETPPPRKTLRLVQELQKLTIRPKGGGLCKLVFDKDHIMQKRMVAKFVKQFKIAEREYNKWIAGGKKGPRTWKALWFIVLKRRQLGSTTLFMAILYILTREYPEIVGQLVAHLDAVAKRQWNMMKRFYKYDKAKKPLEGDKPTKDGLIYDDKWGSECYAITSGGSHVGHGDTTQANIWTEFSRWRKAEETLDGLDNVVPAPEETWLSIKIIESTANGSGNIFQDRWDEAESGKSEYIPVFLGWKDDPSCRMELAPDEELILDDIEAEFAKTWELDREQMKWARWIRINKCRNNWDKFNEQYPISPAVAFMFSGFPVFDAVKIQRQLELAPDPPLFIGDIVIAEESDDIIPKLEKRANGNLIIHKMPEADKTYSLGCDSSDGRKQDFTVDKIFCNETEEEVASYRTNTIYPTAAGIKTYLLGIFYNIAKVCVERTASGSTILSVLEFGLKFDDRKGWPELPPYPNLYYETKKDKKTQEITTTLGFSTSSKSKERIIKRLSEAVGEEELTINTKGSLIQMSGFVNDPEAIGKKKWKQTKKDPVSELPNDDDIMALAFAYEMVHTTSSLGYAPTGGKVADW